MTRISFNLTDKLDKLLEGLIKNGDYNTRSQFINEAILSHLRTWYPKTLEKGTLEEVS